ncbi:CRP/FNR family transcriptional regulator [Dyadobacter jejuensis]|uniref:CRP/FNR family transcriptional regulator n=1 Tax=Dyadobacter jejuensis TaxID=1082580 RepID=A0A316ANC8_9BACT|nr:Crp/Fnr family transcriptional regulator [Dyadobacter jejuensis]PWJ59056.1 CRP/FNR family transcriptional regulator [Dyadobacter jejuensis]
MSDNIPIKTLLTTYFPQFEESLQDYLSTICHTKEFAEGEVLMRTGQHFKYSMLIATGRVKLYRQGEDGNEVFMYELEAGNACALSMICAAKNEESQVMAKAIEPTTAILVPVRNMDELMKSYRSWYYFVIETYRSRFEELLTVLDHVVFKGMDERLEFYLQNQIGKTGNKEIKITHQEIANDLNTSREVISRLLKKMEQNGRVHLSRNTIEWL